MDPIYEKVKANSKFLKIVDEYTNLSGQPTTATQDGANSGTLPTQTQAVDPVMQALRKKQAAATKQAAQVGLNTLRVDDEVNKALAAKNKSETKRLQDIAAGKPIVPAK